MAGAHHSFAAIYDQAKPLHLQGRVENLHARDGSQQAAAVLVTTRSGQQLRAVRPLR
jgi:hypothetical protein